MIDRQLVDLEIGVIFNIIRLILWEIKYDECFVYRRVDHKSVISITVLLVSLTEFFYEKDYMIMSIIP